MNWNRLKDNRCPKCAAPLRSDRIAPAGSVHECSRDGCDFTIGNIKFEQIVQNSYKRTRPRYDNSEENLSALNNLGRKEVTEDFRDSPYL